MGHGSLCNNLDLKIAAQFQSEQLRKPNYDADSKLHSAWARNPNYYARFHTAPRPGPGIQIAKQISILYRVCRDQESKLLRKLPN